MGTWLTWISGKINPMNEKNESCSSCTAVVIVTSSCLSVSLISIQLVVVVVAAGVLSLPGNDCIAGGRTDAVMRRERNGVRVVVTTMIRLRFHCRDERRESPTSFCDL